MDKKALSLFVMGLMLFSVFLVAKPASAQSNQMGDVLKILTHASNGNMFMGVFNPSTSGMGDIYTRRVWYFLSDPSHVTGPKGAFHNYRCELVNVQYNVKVPNSAVIWNGTQKKWVAPYAGKTAQSATTWKCGLGTWTDGQPITLADLLFDYAMTWEWTYQDGKNDKYYDQPWNSAMSDTLALVWGLQVNKLTSDYVEYTIYQDYAVPYDKWTTATGNFEEGLPSHPWETYNVVSQAVANGVNGKPFSWSSQPQGGYRVNMILPEQAPYYKAEAENILKSGNLIPIWIDPQKSGLATYLKDWGITAEQAGITTTLAKQGYEDVIKWATNYGNILITNGPYYVAKYDPKGMFVDLKLANNKRIGFATDKLNGKPIPWEPHWKEIQMYGSLNKDTAVLAVAKGEYALFQYGVPYPDIAKTLQKYGKVLKPIRSISSWNALQINPIGDPNTGLVNSSGTIKFNPMALRGVRYGLNWLINRQTIVSQVYQSSAAPLYAPEVTAQFNVYQQINPVIKALGLTAQGDQNYGLKLIDQAMEQAAKNLKAKGYTLEKKDGKWYLNGQPVTVKVAARVDDPYRLAIGKYAVQLLDKAGFDAQLLKVQQSQSSKMIYHTDPHTLQWNAYTAGFITSGLSPLTWIVWDYWVFDFYYAPNPFAPTKDTLTVKDLVNKVANGDVNKLIKEFQLNYYNTPSKLQPLMDWNAYQLDSVLAFNSYKGPNNATLTITNINQLWDIYKLTYAFNILNSPFVYLTEPFAFYVTNKNLVQPSYVDPVSGVGSFLGSRGLEPVQHTTTSTHTTTTSTHSTTSTHTTSTHSTTQQPTSSSSSTPTSSSSSSGKGICGPAFIVALAALPLLLRRRK